MARIATMLAALLYLDKNYLWSNEIKMLKCRQIGMYDINMAKYQ